MRIDKLLANMNYGSRKEVKKLLRNGMVTVNGLTTKDPKLHVNPDTDLIVVGGEKVTFKEYIYLMMNKPDGVISATEDVSHRTVLDLLAEDDRAFDPFPVGRLDKDTEGLLLLTNDGQLAHRLLSPKRHVPKTYFAKVEGRVSETDQQSFSDGVRLDDGYETKPAQLKILSIGLVSEIELTITEGKYHQVKRMFEAVGKRVVYLKRIKMGSLPLDDNLPLGEYRHLQEKELETLEKDSPQP
ncbi:pseudouridine synthase [Alkalihalobacillus sp. AL-G]|uniref:pseudouridine synthase n=1 Tax=Alkalihalobacillus sp. AL-G TaxID=2926399 RepID=UPI00272AE1EC|nr:pseudouridine synthase [Alkalihalobacillus sp. AL-G]WLD92437.1 rRNA pseudouridine synthase [Alkalihalobacillus sp. AL-G]